LTELPGHASDVLDVAFGPDGQHVATVGDDGLVRVFPSELFASRRGLMELVPGRVTRRPAELTPAERTTYVSD
jgi:WD40 repeat protein